MYQITIDQLQISDLFFNSELRNYKDVIAGDDPLPADVSDALIADDTDFASNLGMADDHEFIIWLVTDFEGRV